MLSFLPQSVQDELEQLSQRYGQPIVQAVDLTPKKLFDPLSKSDRYGEVCMVIRRPNGLLLTMTKTFYPQDAYRLPTGGINYGERVFTALLRETHEETNLEVQVRRFLAAAAYRTPHSGDHPVFYTFAFLLDEIGGTLGVVDEHEQVAGFREIEPSSLPTLAAYFERLGSSYSDKIEGNWGDWGQFRAAIHRLVWEALSS